MASTRAARVQSALEVERFPEVMSIGMQNLRHLTSTTHMSREWVEGTLFPLCEELRKGDPVPASMNGKALYCLFYEPSFLTRTSFERAVGLLGGQAYHTEDASQFFPVHSSRFVDDITSILASLKMDVVVVRSGDPHVTERAASVNAMHVVNGGSADDHPTQALADLYTIQRELGGIDGRTVAVVGRLEHRNVSALLKGLALFDDVEVALVPFSGQAPADVVEYCTERGVRFRNSDGLEALTEVDAIYLNGPRTAAHMDLLRSRGRGRLVINREFMDSLQPHAIVMDPMQRSGDFVIDVSDSRLAFYRQAENALYVRMGVLAEMFRS